MFVRSGGLATASLVSVVAVTALTGCAGAATSAGPARLEVTAAFYPLQYAVERVGGDHVQVTGLTRPGAEPHDLELTPREVVDMTTSKVIVYEKGFQPAVDDAVASIGGHAGFDVSTAARLSLPAPSEPGAQSSLSVDPHFWLDPDRYAQVVKAIATRLGTADPANATAYAQNADALVAQLTDLDQAFRTGLAHCADTNLVTGHAAFGYLARRYGLTQLSVSGISPDVEPTAAQMSSIVSLIRSRHVSTVYAETLVSPALVDTIARETGASVEVLDPIEGITKESAGTDYLAVMRANLATLERGQRCT